MSERAARARESTQLAVAIILVSNHKCTTASVVVALHMCANVVLMVPSVLHRHRAHSAVSRDLESPDNKGWVRGRRFRSYKPREGALRDHAPAGRTKRSDYADSARRASPRSRVYVFSSPSFSFFNRTAVKAAKAANYPLCAPPWMSSSAVATNKFPIHQDRARSASTS